MFKGSLVALVTPMQADGTLDKKALQSLIEWHIAAKTDGLVIIGTTGEAATLIPEEKQEIMTLTVKQVAKRIPVIAGTGTNCTQTSIKNTKAAEAAGVDACLLVTPYYNKPTQNGLYEHYKAIAASTKLPLILYNVPGRTACDMLPETVERLAKITNIVGLKDATANIKRGVEMLANCGNDFMLYSGDDETAAELILQGAHGAISVTANVAPQKMHEMCVAALAGDKTTTAKINAELMPLHKKLFLEANPIPTKWVLQEMGLIQSGIRLPLLPLDHKFHEELRSAMTHGGIQSI